MVSFNTYTLIGLALSVLANGLALPNDGSVVPAPVVRERKFIKYDLRSNSYDNDQQKRDSGPEGACGKKYTPGVGSVSNHNTWYAVDLLVGSNKQKVTVQIDTGSRNLWVVDNNAYCVPSKGDPDDYCKMYGAFDTTASSTYQNLTTKYSVAYLGTNTYTGTWTADLIGLPDGPSVTNMHFGNVNHLSTTRGIMGLSFTNDNNSFPILLRKQGHIAKAAYSVYLNEKSSPSGSIIFGGIDTAKYEGDLVPLPVQGNILSIKLNTFEIGNKTVDASTNVVLDTGNTNTSLTPEMYTKMMEALDARWSDAHDTYVIDCEQPADKYITFNFDGNVSIKVPLSHYVGRSYNKINCRPTFYKGGAGNTQNFGDNFLRNAYVVFDLDDRQISLAQAKYTSESNIIPIE